MHSSLSVRSGRWAGDRERKTNWRQYSGLWEWFLGIHVTCWGEPSRRLLDHMTHTWIVSLVSFSYCRTGQGHWHQICDQKSRPLPWNQWCIIIILLKIKFSCTLQSTALSQQYFDLIGYIFTGILTMRCYVISILQIWNSRLAQDEATSKQWNQNS
jgi:hypothetical protein